MFKPWAPRSSAHRDSGGTGVRLNMARAQQNIGQFDGIPCTRTGASSNTSSAGGTSDKALSAGFLFWKKKARRNPTFCVCLELVRRHSGPSSFLRRRATISSRNFVHVVPSFTLKVCLALSLHQKVQIRLHAHYPSHDTSHSEYPHSNFNGGAAWVAPLDLENPTYEAKASRQFSGGMAPEQETRATRWEHWTSR